MSTRMTDFLIELAVNPDKLASFSTNPDHILEEAGLSPEEKAALKSGDPKRVRECVAMELGVESVYPAADYKQKVVDLGSK